MRRGYGGPKKDIVEIGSGLIDFREGTAPPLKPCQKIRKKGTKNASFSGAALDIGFLMWTNKA